MLDINFKGSDFMLAADEIDTDLLEALRDCGGSGPADAAVEYVRTNFNIVGNVEDCKNYLRGYGAWEDHELEDHNANLDRLIWMTGCDLEEQGEAHFATYY